MAQVEALDWDAITDVVVIGMGAAGCAAAIEARDAGAEVLLLEKMAPGREGGNTRVSGGIWFDNTDPKRAAVYLRSLCGDYLVPEPVIQVWAEETHRNTAWIESLGGKVARHGNYLPEYPELEGSDCYGGYLALDGVMGHGVLFDLLSATVRARGVEVSLGTPARNLVRHDADGPVTGVVAEREGHRLVIRARKGVIIASGGFEGNTEMVHDYLGLPGAPATWGSPAGTGDGIKMAQAIGADLWHMDNMMAAPGIKVPDFPSGFFVQLGGSLPYIYVGPDGTRFVDETTAYRHGHALLHGRYELYPAKAMSVVFDETTRLAGPISPGLKALPVGWNLLLEHYRWSPDNSAEIARGWIRQGDSIADLAKQLDIDPQRLEQTVHEYNQACANTVDPQFGRSPDTLIPLVTPPFYGFDWGPLIGWSNGGPKRNERSQVLDVSGRVIPRLYAAGNVSSTYSWCKDGGFHIADALAFGRVAGRTAAAEPSLN